MKPAPACLQYWRKETDRFNQLPQWPGKGILFDLPLIALRLYLFFVIKANRQTRATPRYPISTLAEKISINRKYIRASINKLEKKNLIKANWRGHRVLVFVIFEPPRGIDFLNSPPLNRDYSLNCHLPSETGDTMSQNMGQNIPDNGTSCPAQCDKLSQIPGWVTDREPAENPEAYEPGADTDELRPYAP